jgi:hypothetical protein
MSLFTAIPLGCSRAEAESLLMQAFAGSRAAAIADLLRPSIRIWPKAVGNNPNTSRFGGLPSVPANWRWPSAEGDRFVFLGQVDCSEIRDAVACHGCRVQDFSRSLGVPTTLSEASHRPAALFTISRRAKPLISQRDRHAKSKRSFNADYPSAPIPSCPTREACRACTRSLA